VPWQLRSSRPDEKQTPVPVLLDDQQRTPAEPEPPRLPVGQP
jgi:hypothetical protein